MDADVGQYVTVRAGTQVKLSGSVRGRPVPGVKWDKADGDINESAIVENLDDGTSLVINESSRNDTGT